MQEKYFLSYSGLALPLNLVSPLGPAELDHRNTYYLARYDEEQRLIEVEKRVYGEVELKHVYFYDDGGSLVRAEITDADGDVETLTF